MLVALRAAVSEGVNVYVELAFNRLLTSILKKSRLPEYPRAKSQVVPIDKLLEVSGFSGEIETPDLWLNNEATGPTGLKRPTVAIGDVALGKYWDKPSL